VGFIDEANEATGATTRLTMVQRKA